MYYTLQDGYVHVMLRQQPPVPGQPESMVKIELSVIDTGKVCPSHCDFGSKALMLAQGISQNFLKVNIRISAFA